MLVEGRAGSASQLFSCAVVARSCARSSGYIKRDLCRVSTEDSRKGGLNSNRFKAFDIGRF